MRPVLPFLLIVMPLTSAIDAADHPGTEQLRQMAARFAPTQITADISRLDTGDRDALKKLIEACPLIDQIFLEQLWTGNHALYEKLRADQTPLGRARFRLFWMSKGPWSDLDEHKAFLPDVPARKPPGANFYPAGMTKAEFEAWISHLPAQEAKAATSFFTVIRRDSSNGRLRAVPYYEAYGQYLEPAARLLKEAAEMTTNASLKRFLELRAAAFLDDDYYASDVAWMDVDAPIDVTIGPYETYNDELFGYKAAFEAYVCLTNKEETIKVADFSSHLQEVENNLPLEPRYRNPKLGALMPIRVVNEVLSAGDGNHGVQTAAFNLPNDEKVVAQKGSKKVMLKNVQHAKFDSILAPISKVVLPPAAQPDLSFEWFFTHILAHELSHGIGPHEISINGRTSSVRLELKDLYSTIEEAKADITGLYMLQYFFDRGILPGDAQAERGLYTTFLASAFRTLRFGITEAHARGMALQFNYLIDYRAFRQTSDGRFEVDYSKVKQAVRELTHELLTMEAQGDYARAKAILDRLGVIRAPVREALNRMSDIPVDIEPEFVTADQLSPSQSRP
jgi:Peptidase family M49